MTNMYVHYQREGGSEAWGTVKADTDLSSIKPTFVTVLSLDTLLDDAPQREVLDRVKYQGPMYFDLDAADISESIEGGKALLAKLLEEGLSESDIEIFLSGKKGLHFLIPEECFMEKVAPVVKLPAIYKEMAFKLAVDTVDFKVYTARKGRMLRTCYNIRENGNYRVPISAVELKTLTPESYGELCKAPRYVAKTLAPSFKAKFALIYEAALQKISSIKRRKPKPVDSAQLKQHLPVVQQILKGEGLGDAGFNKLAIQLCIYAREANWSCDQLVENAQGLCTNHQSDGRYNSPKRREAELRRMYDYIYDNPAYDYDLSALRSCLKKETIKLTVSVDEETGETVTEQSVTLTSGVNDRGTHYVAMKADEGETVISDFVFRDIVQLLDSKDGSVVAYRLRIKDVIAVLTPTTFTSSSGLQNAIAKFGGTFTGTDTHSRGIGNMVREKAKDHYIVETEGLNLVKLPTVKALAGRSFIVWSDRFTMIAPPDIQEAGIKLEFLGYPDERGVIQTDLTQAPKLADWIELEGNRERLAARVKDLCKANMPETVSKALGWMIAANYTALFHNSYQQFPLLHIYGPSGSGKTTLTKMLLKMFYYLEQPKETSPGSTPFALQALLAGSSSIPVLLDEWKPSHMSRDVTEKYRGIFRDVYNGKPSVRGGGSRGRDSFNSLNTQSQAAPLIFAAESAETETAIVHRSVMLSFRRGGKQQTGAALAAFLRLRKDQEFLPILGRHLAGTALASTTPESFKERFDKIYDWAINRYMLVEGDDEKLASGEITQEVYNNKARTEQRPLFNSAVVLFGLVTLRETLRTVLMEQFDAELEEMFRELSSAAFKGSIVGASATQPEYIKVLSFMSDMSKTKYNDGLWLEEGKDFNLATMDGKAVLVLNARFAYYKYRQFSRTINQAPMYPNETSFEFALQEIPQFIRLGSGLTNVDSQTVVLDMEGLQRAGVPPYFGRVANLQK